MIRRHALTVGQPIRYHGGALTCVPNVAIVGIRVETGEVLVEVLDGIRRSILGALEVEPRREGGSGPLWTDATIALFSVPTADTAIEVRLSAVDAAATLSIHDELRLEKHLVPVSGQAVAEKQTMRLTQGGS